MANQRLKIFWKDQSFYNYSLDDIAINLPIFVNNDWNTNYLKYLIFKA